MYTHPTALGIALLGSAMVLAAVTGHLLVYGAMVAAERPLQRWYLKRNH